MTRIVYIMARKWEGWSTTEVCVPYGSTPECKSQQGSADPVGRSAEVRKATDGEGQAARIEIASRQGREPVRGSASSGAVTNRWSGHLGFFLATTCVGSGCWGLGTGLAGAGGPEVAGNLEDAAGGAFEWEREE